MQAVFKLRSLLGLCFCLMAAPLFAACSTAQFEPSEASFDRVELSRGNFEKEIAMADMTPAYLESMAEDWQRHGDGAMLVTVLYDPHARVNGPINAGKQAARLAESLRARGVSVETTTLPVVGRGEVLSAFVSYPQTTARAPESCGTMPGLEGTGTNLGNTGQNDGYRVGCGIETILAKQISRPADLRGVDGLPGPSDGRRVYQKLGAYRAGVENKPLEGESASGGK